MYICICNGITERQVRRAIRDGATTMRELRDELPIANCCGRCAPAARELLDVAGGETVASGPVALPTGCAA
jgi:bacterioferritin-associated ferredoxin